MVPYIPVALTTLFLAITLSRKDGPFGVCRALRAVLPFLRCTFCAGFWLFVLLALIELALPRMWPAAQQAFAGLMLIGAGLGVFTFALGMLGLLTFDT